MALTVYQYPNCSTCKKALKWLATTGVAFTSIDITKAPPQAYAALANDGKLIKRPLALGDGVALVGFVETEWAAALG